MPMNRGFLPPHCRSLLLGLPHLHRLLNVLLNLLLRLRDLLHRLDDDLHVGTFIAEQL